MAIYVAKVVQVGVNGVDLSAYVRNATLTLGTEMQDQTSMANASRIYISGLKTWDLEVDFLQDYAASKVDATLNGLIGGAAVYVNCIPATGASSATNPCWHGLAVLESYQPVAGEVGNMTIVKAKFRAAGDITRSSTKTITDTTA